MHSRFSTNVRCSKFGEVVNVVALPPIEDDNVVECTNGFLEDLECILAGANFESSTLDPIAMALMDQDSKKPQACRDLRSLMSKQESKDLLNQPVSRLGLRNRLETYLVDELHRYEQAVPQQGNVESEEMATEADKAAGQKSRKKGKKQNTENEHPPIVWVIEPGYNKDGTLRFKFTTDGGACLILKNEEALESIEIMKETAHSNTYFQVYSIQGNISRIISPEQISQAVADIVVESRPKTGDDELLTSEPVDNKTKKRLGQRVYRFLLRRRWKNLVRRQVGIAVGDARKGARIFSVVFPMLMIWRSVNRRSRTTL